jgi:hypothetical protein
MNGLKEKILIVKTKDLAEADRANKGLSSAHRENKGFSSKIPKKRRAQGLAVQALRVKAKGAACGCALREEFAPISSVTILGNSTTNASVWICGGYMDWLLAG